MAENLTNILNENLKIYESNMSGNKTAIKTTMITKTTKIDSNVTKVNHNQEHKILTPKSLLFNKILEEEVWLSGSELKTDNSSSDEGEHFDDIRRLRKSISISDELTKTKKGKKRKNSRKTLSSSSIKSVDISNVGMGICDDLESNQLTKQVSSLNHQKLSTLTSNFGYTNTNSSTINKTSSSLSSSKMATIITSTSSSTISSKVLETYDNFSTTSSAEAITSSNIIKTTVDDAGAVASSPNAVEWRPKRGSVSLPGLSIELEQILHVE